MIAWGIIVGAVWGVFALGLWTQGLSGRQAIVWGGLAALATTILAAVGTAQ